MHRYYRQYAQVVIPDKKHCTVRKSATAHALTPVLVVFLRQLENGEKKKLKEAEVKLVNVPHYPAVSSTRRP